MKKLENIVDISSLLPHREPMILVDRIVEINDFNIITAYRIPIDSLFLEIDTTKNRSYFSEMGLLENLAQTSLLFIRLYFDRLQKETNPAPEVKPKNQESLGFISSIQSLNVFQLPSAGDLIQTNTTTTLDYTSDFLKICSIEGNVSQGAQLLLTASMKMLLKSDPF